MDLRSPFKNRSTSLAWMITCLFLVGPHTTSRAQGIRFSQATFSPLPVGGRATTPVIADVNADGHADVVVALESDHAIAVLLGRSQGGFEPAKGSPFPAGNLPFSIALADLDVDGRLDVVAVNRTDNQLTVLRGDGLGGFRATANPIPTGQEPRTVRIADFNQDEKLDLAVANYGGASVSILLGNGSGDFTPAAGSPVPAGPGPWGLTVSDFNGDGAPDFAVAKRWDNSVSVLLNRGGARFSVSSLPVSVGSQPFDVTSADLNHDGKVDLVTADTGSDYVSVLLGDGSGKVTRRVDGIARVNGGYPRMVVVSDLNGDGHLDLVTANENSSISLLAGNGLGNFAPVAGSPIEQPGIMNTVAVGDLNGDGAPDIVGCGPDFGLTIWLNTTNPAFEIVAPAASEADLLSKITLRRTHNLTRRLSFLLTTRDDTAQAGRDYTSVQILVTFEPNQAETVVNIPLTNDDFGKATRHFFVDVSNPDPKVVLPGPASVQVQDDDGLVTLGMEVNGDGLQTEPFTWSPIFPEGGGPIRFTARRSGSLNSTRRFHVHYRVEGRSMSNYAEATIGKHFVVNAAEGDLEFGPGVTEQSVEVAIPDNSEAQGIRGIACQFTYDGLVKTGSDETLVFIGDDERMLLRQQVVLETYLSADILSTSFQMPHAFHELPDGKVLVVLANTLLRLTREGLPDPSFGLGTGRAVLPESSSRSNPVTLDRVLGDGRLQLWQSGKLVRLAADGVPDPSFGGGTGELAIPGELLDTATDGAMIVTDDGSLLKRLLPSGSTDPEFSSAWPVPDGIKSCRISPQGRIWVITWAGEAILFDANGEPKPAAIRRTGVDFFPGIVSDPDSKRAFFDEDERAYFLYLGSDLFGDPTQGRIIRYLANGSYDDTYRPLARETPAFLFDVNPNGTALAVINGRELIHVDSTGGSNQVHTSIFTSTLNDIARAKRCSDGSVLLSSVFCWAFNCSENIMGILGTNGAFDRLSGTVVQQPTDGSLPWYRDSVEAGVQLLRTDTHLGDPRVGLAHSGRFVLESAASVSIQRAGSTAQGATVRGRIFPYLAGQWDTSTAQPFEIQFRTGQTDVEMTLPNLFKVGRQPLREYLVRLESATGVELSDFTACRLWVLDDDAFPGVGELTLERFVGTDERSSALLLGRWSTGKAYQHEYRWDPQIPWQTWSPYNGYPTLGPGWVKPVPTDGPGSGFFRMRSE